jgi:hypothetical protein
MTDERNELRISALLSVQRALLGMVSADLRAVEVAIADRRIRGSFMYDGDLTEEHAEIVDEVETLVIADMEDDVQVEFEAISVKAPAPVAFVRDTFYCFLRRED